MAFGFLIISSFGLKMALGFLVILNLGFKIALGFIHLSLGSLNFKVFNHHPGKILVLKFQTFIVFFLICHLI